MHGNRKETDMNIVEQYLSSNHLEEHEFVQGSPEWIAFRHEHDGSSEVSAALGLSKNCMRNDMLHAKSSGIEKEFSDYVQKYILNNGHEVEAMARPIIEKQIGTKLYPQVYSLGRLSASCDGITMSGIVGWEHKQWNESLAESVRAGELPDTHMPQVQQQLLVTSAEKWIFTVSDGTEERMVSMEVLPDQAWFERILAGWEQFNKDRENYQHIEHAEKPVADAIMALPALFVHARGEITDSNMEEFGHALATSLAKVRSAQLITDQDFSNAEAAAKLYRETGKKLMLAKEAMLEQTLSIGAAARMIDTWHEDLRVTALKLEKDVEREKEAKKLAIIDAGKVAWAEYYAALEAEIKPIRLNITQPDFAGAMKGKRLVSAWQDAVDTALANGKIAADSIAKDVRAKLAWCKENASGMAFLFPDQQTIITKPLDDFTLLIQSRITEHKAAEARKEVEMRAKAEAEAAAKLEAERARMEAEAKSKAEREAAAKLAAEEARIRAEEQAKARAAQVEAEAKANAEAAARAKSEEIAREEEAERQRKNTEWRGSDQTAVAHQDEISAFLKIRNFGKDESRIRAILVEFIKFQEIRRNAED